MRYRLGALLTACMLLVTGCASLPGTKPAEETTMETRIVYQSLPLPNLFVEIPERFGETSSQFYDKYYVCDDASIIITEDTDAYGISPKDYSVRALVEYQDMTASLENVTEDSVQTGGIYVQIMEFTYTVNEDDSPLSVMVGYLTDSQSMFIITCKCAAENYDGFREDFRSVMQSARIDLTPVE